MKRASSLNFLNKSTEETTQVQLLSLFFIFIHHSLISGVDNILWNVYNTVYIIQVSVLEYQFQDHT